MSVKTGFSGCYHLEVFKGNTLVDPSRCSGGFNGNVTFDLDWQPVRQSVTWQEAIHAWVDGKKVSYSYIGYDKRVLFEGFNTMMGIEEIKNAEWYVEEENDK